MKTKILVIGRNADILATVVRLINNNPAWQGTGAQTNEEALGLFLADEFDLVLMGGGIDPESEGYLREVFNKKNPSIRIVQHYGGGSGLLSAEIYEALRS